MDEPLNLHAAQNGHDSALIERLQQLDATTATDHDLADVARLRMRYSTGVLRRQLDQLLLRWDLSEDELHRRTRLHWQQRQAAASSELTYGSGADA
jgi:hypothetical protein